MERAGLAILISLVLVGCGEEKTELSFPAGHVNVAHEFYVPIADHDRAQQLCDATDRWPEEYPDQVTFDFPHTGRDLTCLR